MNKSNKIVLLLAYTFLYCSIASVYFSWIPLSSPACSEIELPQQESYFDAISPDFDTHAIQTRNSDNVRILLPIYSLKNLFNEYSTASRQTEIKLVSHFTAYLFYAKNQIICFQQTDIIFPFHYFW